MAYTLENVNGCTKKLSFNFESIDLSSQISQALRNRQETSNLKGFRKGKAPIEMIKKLYGPQVENDALMSFIQKELFDAIEKEKLRAVGYPTFSNTKYEQGNNVSFDATVEIFPEIKLTDYKGWKFEKDKVSVTDKDIEEIRKNYLLRKSTLEETQDAGTKLAKGHFAIFNFEGEKEDGTRPENMKAKDYMLEMGSGQFIPGFEDGMMGMKKGEKKAIELTFPADYHEPSLKNAKVKFDVEILEIKERKFPDFNDELAKEFGYDSVEIFEKKNKDLLLNQKTRQSLEKLNQQILEKFISENKFDVPKSMIDQQEKYVVEDVTKSLTTQGFNEQMVQDYLQKWQKDLSDKAEFQVRSGLILDYLGKHYKVEATEADFNKKIEEVMSQSGLDRDKVMEFYGKNASVKKNMMYAIREEKTFESLCKDLNISEK